MTIQILGDNQISPDEGSEEVIDICFSNGDENTTSGYIKLTVGYLNFDEDGGASDGLPDDVEYEYDDTVAFWAASILSGRPHADDGISVEAARIVEYVSSNVSRYKIMSLANRLKSDNNIDPHIRAVLTHHDGY